MGARNRFTVCHGQGCVTALEFDPALGTCLWAGTDRGVIQSYTCVPSSGRLIRSRRVDLCSLNPTVPLLHATPPSTGTTSRGLWESRGKRVVESPKRLVSVLGRSIRHKSIGELKGLRTTPPLSFIPSVTSLAVHAWFDRSSTQTHLLANAAGLGLLLFRVTKGTGHLTLTRCFPVVHKPPEPMLCGAIRLHSCFAPLVSGGNNGIHVVVGGENGDVSVFHVSSKQAGNMPTATHNDHNPVAVLRAHSVAVSDVCLSWDGSTFASADQSGAVILWRRSDKDGYDASYENVPFSGI